MRKAVDTTKVDKILLNILLNIIFLGIIFVIVYYTAPVHEFFHLVPCKAMGLEPVVSSFSVNCTGIQEQSTLWKFLFYMGPYIFDSIIIISVFFLAARFRWLKYLIPIFLFDMVFNYMFSLHGSDFRFLLENTYPDRIPFMISVMLVVTILLVAVDAYYKYKIYDIAGDIKKHLFLILNRYNVLFLICTS